MTVFIEEALVSYLAGYSELTPLVSTRVYAMRIPQNATLPCITVQRVSTQRILTHDTSGASTLARPRFQIDVWATTYAAAKAITEQVRTGLNGQKASIGTSLYNLTIRAALVDEESAEFDQASGYYRSRSDYLVWHEE